MWKSKPDSPNRGHRAGGVHENRIRRSLSLQAVTRRHHNSDAEAPKQKGAKLGGSQASSASTKRSSWITPSCQFCQYANSSTFTNMNVCMSAMVFCYEYWRRDNVCTRTYIHKHMHTYIHTYIRTCIHKYIHTYTHTYIHTYVRTYVPTCIHTHTYIHHAYVRTYIHIDRQKYKIIQTYIQTEKVTEVFTHNNTSTPKCS